MEAIGASWILGVVGLALVALVLVGWVVRSVREKRLQEAVRARRRREVEAARERAEADRRHREQSAAAEGARLRQMRAAFRTWSYMCKAHALTCTRCGELAYPIPVTADRYACPSCRHQFAGAPHAVPLPPPNPDVT